MATKTSPTTGQQKAAVTPPPPRQRPGQKPAITDEALLAAIRANLKCSPWTGEGHRKVAGPGCG